MADCAHPAGADVTGGNTGPLAQRFLHHDDAEPAVKFVPYFSHSTCFDEPKPGV